MTLRYELVERIGTVDTCGGNVSVSIVDEITEFDYLDGSQGVIRGERIALHPDGYRLTVTESGFRQLGGDAEFTRV